MDEPIRRFIIMRKVGEHHAMPTRAAGKAELFDTREAAEARIVGLRIVSRYSDPFVNVQYWVEEVQR